MIFNLAKRAKDLLFDKTENDWIKSDDTQGAIDEICNLLGTNQELTEMVVKDERVAAVLTDLKQSAKTAEINIGVLQNNVKNQIGQIIETSNATDTLLPNKSWEALNKIKLGNGTWLVTCTIRFPSNANGYRAANISGDYASTALHINTLPLDGTSTQISFSRIVEINEPLISSGKEIYLNAYQSSGSGMTIDATRATLKAIRIGVQNLL